MTGAYIIRSPCPWPIATSNHIRQQLFVDVTVLHSSAHIYTNTDAHIYVHIPIIIPMTRPRLPVTGSVLEGTPTRVVSCAQTHRYRDCSCGRIWLQGENFHLEARQVSLWRLSGNSRAGSVGASVEWIGNESNDERWGQTNVKRGV